MKKLALIISVLIGLGLAGVLLIALGTGTEAQAAALSDFRVCASGCTYSSVQAAIDAALPGDVIQVATGVYSGVVARGGLQQMAYITKSLTLRGGYSADFATWDPALFPTTLDALGMGRAIYTSGAISVTLDGLRLLNGYASSSGAGIYAQDAALWVLNCVIGNNRVPASFHGNYGVGLYLSGGSLTMQKSVVQENQPIAGGDVSHLGGGLYASNAVVEISDSQFLSNTAAFGVGDSGNGGGAFLENCTSRLQDVIFRNNAATPANAGGGGLWTRFGTLSLLDSTFERNVNGGATLFTDGALVSDGVFTANVGSGLHIATWNTAGVYNVTLTRNVIQNNTGKGLSIPQTAFSLNVENNTFTGNQGGGLLLKANSTTGTPTAVIVRGNLFQSNSTTGDGGGAHISGAVDMLFNRFIDNHASGNGGGIYQGETSRNDNASAVYNGNLLRGNSAAQGGALYIRPEYSDNLKITYQNMALLDNVVTGTASAIFVSRYTYDNNPVIFKHLTLANNTGGDGAMVYVAAGTARFTNTLLYSGTVGIKNNWRPVTLDHVLRYDVVTPTLAVGVSFADLSPVTGDPAFTSDGYHLSSTSAAVDAGAPAGVVDDIDGTPRPVGTAPDIGADESAYSIAEAGVQVSMQAAIPQWKVYYIGSNVPPSTYLQQDYLIPFNYFAPNTAPHVMTYTIHDTFPADLDLFSVSNPPWMIYTRNGSAISWASQTPLLPGEGHWVSLAGRSDLAAGGDSISNVGQLSYQLANGSSGTIPFSATTEVPLRPVFPPVFITPQNGEICLENGNQLMATGVAGAGMQVRIYEDGAYKTQTTADASGQFIFTWSSALTKTHDVVTVYAVACVPGGGTCSAPSRTVWLDYPEADWCPQRSYWEGDAHGVHHIFYFRNDQGRYASNGFSMPGIYGFVNTRMHLYSCCPHDETNPFKVTVDGVDYMTPSHNGRWWTFSIGLAHDITIESQCDGAGGAKVVYGKVLIDPDGFVFDVDKGGRYDAVTGVFSPVEAISGITVTAYVSAPEWGGWIPWPAQFYNDQINPQVTESNGYFAFFTPPGFYYLQASGAGGYQSWRSPVIEVITQVVHMNMPLTPWVGNRVSQVALTPGGIHPAVITVPLSSSVEWHTFLGASPTVTDLVSSTDHPSIRLLSARHPLTDIMGFDSGMLIPNQAYRRQFKQPGVYSYTDGMGRQATIVVEQGRIYLPMVIRH